MSDFADMAEAIEQIKRDDAIAKREPEGPPPCGECYYCGEPLKDGRRFCDTECRDGWQIEMDALRRNRGTM